MAASTKDGQRGTECLFDKQIAVLQAQDWSPEVSGCGNGGVEIAGGIKGLQQAAQESSAQGPIPLNKLGIQPSQAPYHILGWLCMHKKVEADNPFDLCESSKFFHSSLTVNCSLQLHQQKWALQFCKGKSLCTEA